MKKQNKNYTVEIVEYQNWMVRLNDSNFPNSASLNKEIDLKVLKRVEAKP